ncbi:hypothetical protein [Roseobacter weihaiensis]|uniref:hypothetical protein n=1 Tax=Roseobacter weihaiensis TaxID=2763262 RepID=UPI001D0B567A|nr:hypothetical protein [Roseobacter sp. H9]
MRELVMKPRINRRTLFATAGFAAVVAVVGAVSAQPQDMHGTIKFESGKAIPEGRIEIYLEDSALQEKEQRRHVKTRIKSDGVSQTIAFSLAVPASSTPSPTLQVVARLEGEDGWLLARGSAQVATGLPVSITLNKAMY